MAYTFCSVSVRCVEGSVKPVIIRNVVIFIHSPNSIAMETLFYMRSQDPAGETSQSVWFHWVLLSLPSLFLSHDRILSRKDLKHLQDLFG